MLKIFTDAATNLERSGGGIVIISDKQKQLAIPMTEKITIRLSLLSFFTH